MYVDGILFLKLLKFVFLIKFCFGFPYFFVLINFCFKFAVFAGFSYIRKFENLFLICKTFITPPNTYQFKITCIKKVTNTRDKVEQKAQIKESAIEQKKRSNPDVYLLTFNQLKRSDALIVGLLTQV
jgi:hypothetical protein